MGTCTSTPSIKPQDAASHAREPSSNTKAKKPAKKKSISKVLRRKVWDAHFGPEVGSAKCPCCEDTLIRQMEFHCGHIVPECKGGPTTLGNLIPICAMCNLSMGSTNQHEFKKHILTK